MVENTNSRDRPAAGAEPQPWHAADEKKPRRSNAPVGTHSLTGGGAQVGMPENPAADKGAERSDPRPDKQEPDPLAEPRASIGEILGRKP